LQFAPETVDLARNPGCGPGFFLHESKARGGGMGPPLVEAAD